MNAKFAAAAIATAFAILGIPLALTPSASASIQNTATASNATTTSNMIMLGNMSDPMTWETMGDTAREHMQWYNKSGKMFGIISSIQNSEEGEPAWVLAGHWMITNDTSGINATEGGPATNITDFHAGFYMTMFDGSAQHPHEIYNFTQLERSTTEGNETTVVGTATVTLAEGPVHDVDTEITISGGNIIGISVDPEQTDNHFGNTPIYGMVITPEIIEHSMSQMMNATHGMTGDMMGRDYMTQANNTGITTPAMSEELEN
ncbi:MAG TPA: hypothetical protein VNI77_01770 [Nitrososphaera sp.]|nr:hypothetical protein [Nitrososphaera sp.]